MYSMIRKAILVGVLLAIAFCWWVQSVETKPEDEYCSVGEPL